MKTVITLVLAEELSRHEKAYLAQLLADALDDFRAARGPTPEDYLVRRYQNDSRLPMTPDAIEYKLEEIKTRVGLAKKLHNSALSARIHEEHEDGLKSPKAAVNFLTGMLRQTEVVSLVDAHYKQFNNPAPAKLLEMAINDAELAMKEVL
jgi:hypothetical protein